jgi:hypothetical protein
LLAVFGIVSMMFAGLVGTASAGQNPSGGDVAFWDGTEDCFRKMGPNESDDVGFDPFFDGAHEVYFAAVSNAVSFGLGPT